MTNFADRLVAACRQKNSIVCVGIDPRLDLLPEALLDVAVKAHPGTAEAAAAAYTAFAREVMDAVADVAVVVKPQVAFFEALGPAGMQSYRDVIACAHAKGLLVIADVKRSDIGSTAQAYAEAFLGKLAVQGVVCEPWGADSVTVNPYLGSDGLQPFIETADKAGGGLFVLVKTSNPSSGELQDLVVADGRSVYEHVAAWVADHAKDLMGNSGYSSLGAVVGATYPEQLKVLRRLMPQNILLIPGYGAQGGGAEDVRSGLNPDGLGAVVNASRSVIFAYRDKTWAAAHKPSEWQQAVRDAALKMRDELNEVRP